MYLEHYGLTNHPFQITPDVNFFFDSRVHRRALATITYGLSKQEGFVVVTGDVGAGKTTLIEYLLASGDLKKVVVARISTTQLEADNLLELICSELELRKSGATKAAMLRDLKSFFLRIAQAGKYVLLIVDEVQNLSSGALEELRMLSNFQDKERPLVQQLLVGQPEFRVRLGSPECEQIRQRVIASYHLLPLTEEEVPIYIDHRLHQAGNRGAAVFTAKACQRIHAETGGVPRKINRLCDRLLLFGFLEDIVRIDVAAVDNVTTEMRLENLIEPDRPADTSGIDASGANIVAPGTVATASAAVAPVDEPMVVEADISASTPEQPVTAANDEAEKILELDKAYRIKDQAPAVSGEDLVSEISEQKEPSATACLRQEHEALLETVSHLQAELQMHKKQMEYLQKAVFDRVASLRKKA